MPKVSIIIPAFNNYEYLLSALNSVLRQTYTDFEIIIVDDGSTDNTAEVVKEYTKLPRRQDTKLPIIRYIYQRNSGGPAKPRNKGIREAKGEYIAFLDLDDFWLPQKLEKQVSMALSKPHYEMVFTDCQIRTKDYIKHESFLRQVPHFRFSEEINITDLLKGNFIYPSTVIIKKECLGEDMYFNEKEKFRGNEDYDLWLRFIEKYRIGFLNEILCVRLFHKSNLSRCLDNQLKGEFDILSRFSQRSEGFRELIKERIRNINFELGYYYFEQRKRKESVKYFSKVLLNLEYGKTALLYLILLLFPLDFLQMLIKIKRKANLNLLN